MEKEKGKSQCWQNRERVKAVLVYFMLVFFCVIRNLTLPGFDTPSLLQFIYDLLPTVATLTVMNSILCFTAHRSSAVQNSYF